MDWLETTVVLDSLCLVLMRNRLFLIAEQEHLKLLLTVLLRWNKQRYHTLRVATYRCVPGIYHCTMKLVFSIKGFPLQALKVACSCRIPEKILLLLEPPQQISCIICCGERLIRTQFLPEI
jgi:hypothetical protein